MRHAPRWTGGSTSVSSPLTLLSVSGVDGSRTVDAVLATSECSSGSVSELSSPSRRVARAASAHRSADMVASGGGGIGRVPEPRGFIRRKKETIYPVENRPKPASWGPSGPGFNFRPLLILLTLEPQLRALVRRIPGRSGWVHYASLGCASRSRSVS